MYIEVLSGISGEDFLNGVQPIFSFLFPAVQNMYVMLVFGGLFDPWGDLGNQSHRQLNKIKSVDTCHSEAIIPTLAVYT